MKAWTFAGESGKPAEAPFRPRWQATASAAREALIEMVAEADDALMEKFFDAGTLTQEDLVGGLQARRRRGPHLPAALHLGRGQHRHAAAARRDRAVRAVTGGERRAGSPTARRATGRPTTGRRAAFVWKTVADPFAGRITLFRVLSGTLKADSTLHNVDARIARAPRPPAPAAGQDADERPRDARPATSAPWRS